MTKLKLLALGVLAATAVSTAQAESQWTVGAGVGVINSPYKQYDRDVYPVPVVTYEGDNVGSAAWVAVTICGMIRQISFPSWRTMIRRISNRVIAIAMLYANSTSVKAA